MLFYFLSQNSTHINQRKTPTVFLQPYIRGILKKSSSELTTAVYSFRCRMVFEIQKFDRRVSAAAQIQIFYPSVGPIRQTLRGLGEVLSTK